MINRQDSGGKDGTSERARFTDGRLTPVSRYDDRRTPLMADKLRLRGDEVAYGWYHGGGAYGEDGTGLLNSSCHTLFLDGRIEYRSWGELEAQGPGLEMGAEKNDRWWFWLGE